MDDSTFYGSSSTGMMALEDVDLPSTEDPNHQDDLLLDDQANTAESSGDGVASKTNIASNDPALSFFEADTMASNETHGFTLSSTQGRTTSPQGNTEHGLPKELMMTSTTAETKEDAAEESEYDTIARETAFLLDKKLDNTRAWAKKLLREITVYVKTLEDVQTEYVRVQRLEHEESDRLDQVEPDVQGATSHVLGHTSHQAHMASAMSYPDKNSDKTVPGVKRRLHQE
jgi:hypothetical protein